MPGRKQKMEEWRGWETKTLAERMVKTQKELVMLRISRKTGDVKNPLQKRHLRREIAKMKTIQREKELQNVVQS